MGAIITFTGDSGSGKSTIVNTLLKQSDFYIVTSTTTRQRRESDLPGEYEYISQEHFLKLKENKEFIWAPEYAGNNYGTKYKYIDEAISSDKKPIMILVPEVMPILLKHTNQVIPFYIKALSTPILKERLKQRGDSTTDIERRLGNFGLFEQKVLDSGISYITITNDTTVDAAIKQVLSHLAK